MIRRAKPGILNPANCQEAGKPKDLCNVLDGTLSVSELLLEHDYGLWRLTHWSVDAFVFYYGTSRNILGMIDVRSASSIHPEKNDFQSLPVSPEVQLTNDGMVNTLYVSRDGIHVITGDSKGSVKVWDVRARK